MPAASTRRRVPPAPRGPRCDLCRGGPRPGDDRPLGGDRRRADERHRVQGRGFGVPIRGSSAEIAERLDAFGASGFTYAMRDVLEPWRQRIIRRATLGPRGSVDDDFGKRWAVSNSGPDEQPQEVVDRLQHEVAALRRSRRRLAEAAYADRSAIERDLHDGVQQHLVALAVNLQRLARMSTGIPAPRQRCSASWRPTCGRQWTRRWSWRNRRHPSLLRAAASPAPSGLRRRGLASRRGRGACGCRLPAGDDRCCLLVLRRCADGRVARVAGDGHGRRRGRRADLRHLDRRTPRRRAHRPSCVIASRRSMAASPSTSRPDGGARVHGWLPLSR